MNNYLKKIKSKKRKAAILLGLAICCVIGVLLMALSLASDNFIIYAVGLFVTAAAAIAALIIALIVAANKNGKIERRIEALQTTSPNAFDNIKFEKISPEVYIGEDWLAYQKGFDYRFWTREVIADAKISQNKQSSSDGVLDIYTKGTPEPEEMPVSEAGQLQTALAQWLGSNTPAAPVTEPASVPVQ